MQAATRTGCQGSMACLAGEAGGVEARSCLDVAIPWIYAPLKVARKLKNAT